MTRPPRLYALLLRLLPRSFREAHGDEMRRVFAELHAGALRDRGRVGVVGLWLAEVVGLVTLSVRERFGRTLSELRWVWLGLRGRGWTAALSVGLLALALAGNTVLFAVTDSLVFKRLTYRDPDRLIEIQDTTLRFPSSRMSADLLDQWAANTDVLSGLAGYLQKTMFLQGEGAAEIVGAADVTPGTFELLGVLPRWGRSFTDDDTRTAGFDVVVVSEELARQRFGDARLAVGRRLETTDLPLEIVGVMPRTFRFPLPGTKVWRALDSRGELVRGFAGLATVGRLADSAPFPAADAVVRDRGAAVAAAAGLSRPYAAALAPFREASASSEQGRLLFVLLAAGGCLLLIACANVASLELAGAVNHARSYGVQLALGASRGLLARVALLETGALVFASTALGAWLAASAIETLKAQLPAVFEFRALNPIDLDVRTLAFMTAVAAVCWLLSSLPALAYASRAQVLNLIKLDGRMQSASRGGVQLRRLLTVVQVAAAVLLLIGSVLYARSYVAMLRVDKGFDSHALAYVDFTIPPQMTSQRADVQAEVLARLKQLPGVVGALADSPPDGAATPMRMPSLEVDGTVRQEEVSLAEKPVSPQYFQTLGIPIRAGRSFVDGEPYEHVILDEKFARQFWPDGAVGHTFRGDFSRQVRTIIGVAGHVRTDGVRRDEPFFFYTPPPPPQVVQAAAPQSGGGRVSGGWWGLLQLAIRLDSPERADEVLRAARAMAPQFQMKAGLVDESYAGYEKDILLVSRTVSAFGVVAFVVAMTGIYGVMAFIVAGRRREIGIRMALGADRRAISRLVIGSSLRLTLIGVGVGLVAALAASRFIQSHLFGITSTDPSTYGLVGVLIAATAIVATWHPARQACRVDPAVTLRAE